MDFNHRPTALQAVALSLSYFVIYHNQLSHPVTSQVGRGGCFHYLTQQFYCCLYSMTASLVTSRLFGVPGENRTPALRRLGESQVTVTSSHPGT